MENLNNQPFDYNNIKVKVSIEYYDYTKSKGSNLQELVNKQPKQFRSFPGNHPNSQNLNSYGQNNYTKKFENRKNNFEQNQFGKPNKFQNDYNKTPENVKKYFFIFFRLIIPTFLINLLHLT